MPQFIRSFCLLLTLSFIATWASADPAHAPPAGDDPLTSPRTAWFRSAKFGMFIHWGLYSVAAGEWNAKSVDGTGEWIMHQRHIPWPEYELLARDFHPTAFDANTWIAVAKDAQMKYLVVTAKHHDGFCMWATKITPWNVIDSTPFGRDPLKELSAACKAEGIKFGVYYSIMDWHHPELAGYWNAGSGAARDPSDPRVISYIEGQLKPQLRELIVEYDPALLWFDGEWQPWWDEQHGKDLQAFCRRLKPDLVINNRVGKRNPTDGDYETPEQVIPESAPSRRLWETCMTLNDTWGYKKSDHHWKNSPEVIARLGEIGGKGGNFLLNVGPDAAGHIPPESVIILREAGQWLRANHQPLNSTDPERRPVIKTSRSLTRRHILRIGAGAGVAAAVGAVATLLRAQPPQPADLDALLPQMKPIRQALNQRACDLVDRNQLVRGDGFIQTVDPAQLMIYFAQVGDATHYLALREHAEKNLILTERDGSYTKGFVAWRWKQGEKPDASGTTEALRIARGLWLGAKAFNRPADAELALQVIEGYSRHATVDQGVWMIRNYFNLSSHSWANNSFLVDYDPDFLREVADQQKDKDLATLADNCYGVVKKAVAPSGLLYDIIQPEVSTLYPELNVAFFSPNGVVQFSNCCTTALSVAKGQPETARKVLAFGLNRLDDLHAYYKEGNGEPYNDKSAAVTEYSVLARLAVRLGAEQAAATVADRAMNDWRWCVNHIETIQVFTLTEILLSLHELATMKG